VSAKCKTELDAAAARSGRSQSQEAELRIENSLRDQEILPQALELLWGHDIAHVLQQIGQIMVAIAPLAVGVSAKPQVGRHFGRWMQNAFARDVMIRQSIAYLSQFLPTPGQLAEYAPAPIPDVDRALAAMLDSTGYLDVTAILEEK
jgi:hypothetical protein